MINSFDASNYKSLDKLELHLGRINVLIGENGAGKSNILEAIALAGAASAGKLDNEFLSSRGIRVTPPEYMRPAFPGHLSTTPIFMKAVDSEQSVAWTLTNDNAPYSKWTSKVTETNSGINFDIFKIAFEKTRESIQKKDKQEQEAFYSSIKEFAKLIDQSIKIMDQPEADNSKNKKKPKPIKISKDNPIVEIFAKSTENKAIKSLSDFIIYSPENSSLRTFAKEGQIEPLGINGEGLMRLLAVISENNNQAGLFEEITSSLKVLGWFESLAIVPDGSSSRIEIQDKYLDNAKRYFDQLSANEGFLFLLFYFTLFSSDLTPQFFAIDNIDASLNPKLCQKLTKLLVQLAKKHNKQVILTTHNPAVLDGLNLDDDEQRLFVVTRNRYGCTRVKRIQKQESSSNEKPVRLSEAFLRGTLGGLPRGF